MENHYLTALETIIENYVKGNLNISKERMSQSREDGGLGLFSLRQFLMGQNCAWAKRAQNLDDNWKLRLYCKSLGSTLNLRSSYFNKEKEPILYNIAEGMESLVFAFGKTRENIRDTYVALNQNIFYGGEEPITLGPVFFGENYFKENCFKIGNILVSDVLKQDGGFFTHEQFTASSGIRITEEKFTVMRRACAEALDRYKKETQNEKKSTDLRTFVNRFKKGSKNFRRILTGTLREEIPRNIQTFAASTQTFIGLEMGLFGT
jgi:hypothetical protein